MIGDELFDLPKGWVWTIVNEIAIKIHYGYTAKANGKNIGPKFLRITDIQNNNVNWNLVPYCEISEEDIEKYLLSEGDLLFARTGATVGKSFLITGKIPEAIFASYLIRIIINNNVNKKYISYFFHSNHYWSQIHLKKIGSGQPNVNGKKLANIKLPLPPLSIQNQIVQKIEELFSKLDMGINLMKQVKAQLEVYRKAVLKYAFEGKLTKKWREFNKDKLDSASLFLEELIELRKIKIKKNRENFEIESKLEISNLKDLPKEWKITKLGNILTFYYGKGLRNDKRDETGKYPVYGSNGIVGYHSSYLINDNCLIIGRKGSVGRVHISYLPSWPIDTTYYIISPDNLNIKFIYYLIKSLNLEFLDRSTAIPGLNRNDAYSKIIPFPPKLEQDKIVEELDKHFSYTEILIKLMQNNLNNSIRLRQKILNKAFEGKLNSLELYENKLNNNKEVKKYQKIKNKNSMQKKINDYVN